MQPKPAFTLSKPILTFLAKPAGRKPLPLPAGRGRG